MSDLSSLYDLLAKYNFRWQHETDIQNAVELLLLNAGVEFVREDPIGPNNRPDFMVGKIAIEVKVEGSLSLLTRQIYRYVCSDAVDGVLVVTTRSTHRRLQGTLRQKPIRVLYLNPF